jgi:hypothetical protein
MEEERYLSTHSSRQYFLIKISSSGTTSKENYGPISLMNRDINFLAKYQENKLDNLKTLLPYN